MKSCNMDLFQEEMNQEDRQCFSLRSVHWHMMKKKIITAVRWFQESFIIAADGNMIKMRFIV